MSAQWVGLEGQRLCGAILSQEQDILPAQGITSLTVNLPIRRKVHCINNIPTSSANGACTDHGDFISRAVIKMLFVKDILLDVFDCPGCTAKTFPACFLKLLCFAGHDSLHALDAQLP